MNLIRIVDIGASVRIHAHAYFADIRVNLSSIESATAYQHTHKRT